ncbi:hypothetical protein ACPPVT_13380 [Angustibacter sp. McL0619]|uniref:hypothetical protein n=1 Tax=Angustibacter sp. McL0619 TaxID=3415676 RepID=UPI003CF9F6CB
MAVISVGSQQAPPTAQVRLPHPLVRATAWSSAIGLVAGLVLGMITQAHERDRG